MGFQNSPALEAGLLPHPDSFLVIHLTDFQCVSNALIVQCPSAADRVQWLEKTQQAQVWEIQVWEGGMGPLELRNWSTEGRRKRERLELMETQTVLRRETQP